MKGKFCDDFAVGIIDNDKRRPQYLDECCKLAESEHLCLYRHPHKHHYMITISPAAEGFILSAAAAAGISMPDYSLPSDLKGLKKITKNMVTSKDPNLVRLFCDLKTGGEFNVLQNVLEYLLQSGFSADQNVLVAFFNRH